jgi:hypothetical protein
MRPHFPKGRNKDAEKRSRNEQRDQPLVTDLSFEQIIDRLATTPPPKPVVIKPVTKIPRGKK